jgi:hypothetical protein
MQINVRKYMNCKKYTEVINERYLINKKASKLLFKGFKAVGGGIEPPRGS